MQQHRGTWWGKNVWQKPSVFSRLLCNDLVPRTVANQQLGEEEKEEVVKRCDIISSVCTTWCVWLPQKHFLLIFTHRVINYSVLVFAVGGAPPAWRGPVQGQKVSRPNWRCSLFRNILFCFLCCFSFTSLFLFFCLPLKSKGLRVIGKERPSGFQADGEKPQEMFLNTVSAGLSNKLRPTPPRSPRSQPLRSFHTDVLLSFSSFDLLRSQTAVLWFLFS